ncbi:carboxylate--amine ligase [Mycobacteriaceae bacterium 1482268.1]|nr:carboxylate--amine ligase [Mycobacteriaceae bacterium 1482268.1]
MIIVLISPRNASLPLANWLPELTGRLIAITAAGVAVGEGFADVIRVADYHDDDAVLAAARSAAELHRPQAILALAEVDVERAAALRSEFELPGLDSIAGVAYRDKILMKKYAQAAGIRVPDFAAVTTTGEIAEFMARHLGRVVVKPRGGSGSTGVHVLETPQQAADLGEVVASEPYQVEEFVDGVLHHVDAFRVLGVPVAAVASHYTGQGCLEHWTDAPFGSRTLAADDPVSKRLIAETWRLVDALPSPPTISVHAEFFVTAHGEIVLCEVAARIGGGPIPRMLHQVLGIDPREMWARVECGLPTDLHAVAAHAQTAPLAAFYGVPPRRGRVSDLPEKPAEATDFVISSFVGDEWNTERYQRRKSADFLASWVVTATDGVSLTRKLNTTAAAVIAGFSWDNESSEELR